MAGGYRMGELVAPEDDLAGTQYPIGHKYAGGGRVKGLRGLARDLDEAYASPVASDAGPITPQRDLSDQAGLSDIGREKLNEWLYPAPIPQDPRMLAYQNQRNAQLAQQAWDWMPERPGGLSPVGGYRMGSTVEPTDEAAAAAQAAREAAARRMRGQVNPSAEVERRWPEAPSEADTYKAAGMPYMGQYYQPTPQEERRTLDRATTRAQLPEADMPRHGPDWLYSKAPDPFGGELQSPRTAQALDVVGGIGAGMVIPQSLWDVPGAVLMPLKAISAPLKIAALAATHALEPDEAEAGGLTPRQAMRLRKARAMGGVMEGVEQEFNPRAIIGGNMPPENMRISPEVPPALAQASPSAAMAGVPPELPQAQWSERMLPRPQPAARSSQLQDIRELPVDQATEIAGRQPHLIKSGPDTPGMYVGAPRDITSKAGLNAQRRRFDEMISSDTRGGDWYDRARAAQELVTGGVPENARWSAAQHGQWSAGVSPEVELNAVLNEVNSSIAGMPVKSMRPAQHEAHMRALAQNDPGQYQLAEKTQEYANKNDINIAHRGATGVNDFRYGWVQGYRDPATGGVVDRAFSPAEHKWMDYETALAVRRANTTKLGGREDWTGEKLQAIPWVIDKAHDLMSRNPNLTLEEAMVRANRTIADYFPKHTYYMTHEAQPGSVPAETGHMMGSVAAPKSEKDEFFRDRSTWATAPGGRDAIYAGLGTPGTGNYMRVLPTVPMQGRYVNPDGTVEENLGEAARPLTGMKSGTYPAEFIGPRQDLPFKRTPDFDRAVFNAGEHLRALIDAQNVSAGHKFWPGGPLNQSTSLRFLRNAPASEQELAELSDAAAKRGLTDIVDTGQGITATKFYEGPPAGGKDFDKAVKAGEFDKFGPHMRVRVGPEDSTYADLTEQWRAPQGSGEATRKMLEYVTATPELRAAFNNNPYIADVALARLERDTDWAARWGAPREDIQNLRKIMSEGPPREWLDRVQEALRNKAILPVTAAALFAGAKAEQERRDARQ